MIFCKKVINQYITKNDATEKIFYNKKPVGFSSHGFFYI